MCPSLTVFLSAYSMYLPGLLSVCHSNQYACRTMSVFSCGMFVYISNLSLHHLYVCPYFFEISVCLFVSVSVHQLFCPCACPPVQLFVCMYMYVCLSICPSISLLAVCPAIDRPSVSLSVCTYVYIGVCVCVYQCLCLSVSVLTVSFSVSVFSAAVDIEGEQR